MKATEFYKGGKMTSICPECGEVMLEGDKGYRVMKMSSDNIVEVEG